MNVIYDAKVCFPFCRKCNLGYTLVENLSGGSFFCIFALLKGLEMKEFDLSLSPLFSGFSEEQKHHFFTQVVTGKKEFAKGELVARQGETVGAMFLLVSGCVRTEMVTKEGNVLEIEMIEAVAPLASAFLFASDNKFPVDVVAMEDSVVIWVRQDVWLQELMRNELLLKNYLMLNSNITVFLSKKMQMLSIKSLKAKLALYLLENTSATVSVFVLRRSRTQLAEYFGVQRPSLVRTFGELEKCNTIALNGRRVQVLDRVALEQMI